MKSDLTAEMDNNWEADFQDIVGGTGGEWGLLFFLSSSG